MNINLINLSQDTRFSENVFDDLSHDKLTILFRAFHFVIYLVVFLVEVGLRYMTVNLSSF